MSLCISTHVPFTNEMEKYMLVIRAPTCFSRGETRALRIKAVFVFNEKLPPLSLNEREVGSQKKKEFE
jgi:hypothetical protein